MADNKLKCENCGFEEELTAAQAEERKAAETYDQCSQCGATLTQTEEAAPAKGKKGAKDKTVKSKDEQAATSAEEVDATADAAAEEGTAEKSEAAAKMDAAKESAKQAAEAAKAQFKKAFAAGRNDPIFITNLIDCGVKKLTALIKPDIFDTNASRAITLGHYAILLLSAACLIMGIVLGIRMGTATLILQGVGAAVLLLLAQYVAVKSFQLFDKVIDTHPSKLSGPGLVEILAIANMIAAVGGIAMLVNGIISLNAAIVSGGVLTLVFAFLMSVVLMQAEKHLNVQYDKKTGLGENLIGLVSVAVKTHVKLVPYIFGFGLVVSTILCIFPFATLLIKGSAAMGSYFELISLVFTAGAFAFSPILLYIAVISIYLTIDVLRAILSLGKK